ncbi:MAG TPA: glycosyltransferase family 39 protein [Solirubrobacteraceae bacterium]|nr:glycosyltransferase family 39 protein [Solirubrobacteraceae bacterium]
MATTAPERRDSLWRIPPIRDYRAPARFERLPRWVSAGGVLLFFVAVSAFIRLHYLDGELWAAEGATVGVATHSLTQIPGILWHGGGAPLYFWLLHVWIDVFGASEIAVHAMSVLTGLLTIPAGAWLAWSLWGRRAGFLAAALFAFNGFLTQYAEEARPYELMGLLGLLCAGAFVHLFVYRRRRGWLPLFTVCLILLAYTDYAGFLFWAGCAAALGLVWRRSEDRPGVARDGLIAFGVAALVFIPWLPTLIHQMTESTAPWQYVPLPGANIPRKLLGTDRVVAVVAFAWVAGLIPLLTSTRRRAPEATAVVSLILLSVVALLLALVALIVLPDWDYRLFAPLVGPLLLVTALAAARANLLGLLLVALSCAFLANPASFIPYKSDVKDIAGELQSDLRSNDVVLVAQPEQAPLAWYYLPAGLRFYTALGPDPHPSWVNWDNALSRLQQASPRRLVSQLTAALQPGQRLLYIRPLTEGVANWSESWAVLVRRRAAQIGEALASDPQLSNTGSFAPHYYHGSIYLPSSALLFVKR